MKLGRYGQPGAEQPGVLLDDGTRIDASGFVRDYDEAFFGGDGVRGLRDWVKTKGASAPKIGAGVRVGPSLARPSKIVCIGLNFKDHAAESKMDLPKEPILFFKATSSIVGPNDDLVIPKGASKVDWEVELAVVIGKKASYVDEATALDHIAGYALHNDYSERAFQLERGGQWVKGKSCDTFAPIGPFIATTDDIKDPQSLGMWLTVNGVSHQKGTTANMVFGAATLVSYISQFMTLLPGDVISTGTPAGVGLGHKPEPLYLKPGDVVELGIDGLGRQRQSVKAFAG
jgi:2-keto-4-pentenoate hydratase/2-oxohepta-3-ene-1,7-dioic acid hydratase in catechol pathway